MKETIEDTASAEVVTADDGPREAAPRGSLELYEDGEMPALEDAMRDAALLADDVLARMPGGLAEARKIVSVELWTLPRPEEVQALARLGEDTGDDSGRRAFARRLVALRLVVQHELRAFWDAATIESSEIRVRADRLRELLFRVTELADEIEPSSPALSQLDPGQRASLRSILKVLQPKRESLLAAVVVGPVLADLLDWAEAGDLETMVGSLTEEEGRLFGSRDGTGTPVARPLRRTCIEVAAIRWLIQEDLTAWAAAAPAGEPAGHEDDARNRLRHQARDHKIAYKVISGRLQALQDAADRTGQKEQADLLNSFRRSLQTSHTGLMEILDRPGKAETQDLEGTGQFSIEIGDGGQGRAESVEDVIGRAVGDSDVSGLAAQADPRRAASFWKRHNWWRMAGLSGIAVLLTVIAVLLQVYHPGDAPPPIAFSPSDATNVIALTDTTSIGTMLYARVSPLWNSLTDREKLMELNGLARLATDRGFQSVLLVDEAGEPMAEWNQSTGPELKVPLSHASGAGLRPGLR